MLIRPYVLPVAFFLFATVPLARSLAGAGVGVGALAANRQAAAVPQAAIGAHLDEALDVQRDFLAEIAFDRAFVFEGLTDVVDFLFGQVADLLVRDRCRARCSKRLRPGPADAVDVGQPDLSPLLRLVNQRLQYVPYFYPS